MFVLFLFFFCLFMKFLLGCLYIHLLSSQHVVIFMKINGGIDNMALQYIETHRHFNAVHMGIFLFQNDMFRTD